MNSLAFDKLHGAQNDFLFVNGVPSDPVVLAGYAQQVCHRHKGIGADGLVFWEYTPESFDLATYQPSVVRWHIVNADGSVAATCGNALRCLGLLLLMRGFWQGRSLCLVKSFFTNDTVATLYGGELLSAYAARIRVGMGQESMVLSYCGFGGFDKVLYVELANPHLVVLSEKFEKFSSYEFKTLGRALQEGFVSPRADACNVGMLYKHSATHQWNLSVYERGVGLTASCGSGAVAACVALEVWEGVSSALETSVVIATPGAELKIGCDFNPILSKKERTLEGPAVWIGQGNTSIL